MKNLGKWKCATSLFGPRDGALLRSPIADDTPHRTHDAAPADWEKAEAEAEALGGPNARHTHVWIDRSVMAPAQPAPRRQATRDAAAPIRRPTARRDQAGEPEPGQLVCKLAQNGETGQWGGTDCDGRPVTVTRAEDGTLEIRHAGKDNEDPDEVAKQAPVTREPNVLAPGARDFEQRMSRSLSPSRGRDQRTPENLRGLQALLSSHYARKT